MSLDRIYRQALKAFENKDLPKATKLFLKILKHHPNHLDAHYLLGTLFAEQGLHRKALHHLNEAVRINPNSPMIYTNLGIIHLQSNDYKSAEISLRTALAIDENLYQAHFNLAIVLQQTHQITESLDHFLSTLKIDPYFFPALLRVAQIQKESGDLVSAESNARKAVKIQPENIDALYLLANILAQSEQVEQTIEIYQLLLKLNPDDESAAYVLSVLNEKNPNAPPRTHFENIFNDIADKFDHHLQTLGYQGPRQLLSLLQKTEKTQTKFNRLLDIGCGTGAVGQLFHDQVNYLMGIDIADKMLGHCEKTGWYNDLECADLLSLDAMHKDFDLVVAADVFPYLGELNPIIQAIGQRMSSGGFLLFTTERDEIAEGYYVDKLSGRYRFSDEYLKEVAQKQQFKIIHMQTEPLRKEKNEWILGHFCVWQK